MTNIETFKEHAIDILLTSFDPTEHHEDGLDFRVWLRPDGSLDLCVGLSDFDTSHAGVCAAGTIDEDTCVPDVVDSVLEELTDRVLDECNDLAEHYEERACEFLLSAYHDHMVVCWDEGDWENNLNNFLREDEEHQELRDSFKGSGKEFYDILVRSAEAVWVDDIQTRDRTLDSIPGSEYPDEVCPEHLYLFEFIKKSGCPTNKYHYDDGHLYIDFNYSHVALIVSLDVLAETIEGAA